MKTSLAVIGGRIVIFDDDAHKPLAGLAPDATPEAAQTLADAHDNAARLAIYKDLHDGLSDMIESGRLKRDDIPEDYAWIVATLAKTAST